MKYLVFIMMLLMSGCVNKKWCDDKISQIYFDNSVEHFTKAVGHNWLYLIEDKQLVVCDTRDGQLHVQTSKSFREVKMEK